MNHTDTLQGYSMLTAITTTVLNQDLARVFKEKLVPTQIQEHIQGTVLDPSGGASLMANLSAPEIRVLAGSENQRELAFILNIDNGNMQVGTGSHSLALDNWKYCFMVPLGVMSYSPAELQLRKDVPEHVKTQVKSFSTQHIKVSIVYLDFGSTKMDTTNYLRELSSCPVPDALGGGSIFDEKWVGILSKFQTCLLQHFSTLEAANNSYHLGYMVTVDNPAKDFISLPLFNPSACSYATSYNEQDETLSSLNFMLMTNANPIPTALDAGLYPSWVTQPHIDGNFVIGRDLLFDQWILPKLVNALAWTLVEGDTSKIKITKEQYGWQITYDQDDNWDKSAIHYQQVKMHHVQVRPQLDVSNNASILLQGDYSNKVVLHDKLLAEASMKATQAWTITLKFAIDKNGKLATVVESEIPTPHIQVNENTAAKILNALMAGELKVQMNQVAQDWASHEHELAACLDSELSDDYSSRFILPSGIPISCEDIWLDQAANLLIGIHQE